MDLGLAGRVALVTGGSKGIGAGIARALAAEGARVAVASRSEERASSVAGEIGGRGYAHDTGDAGAAADLVARVGADLGPVEILVTNSGGPPASSDPLSFGLDQWEDAYRSLVLGPIALVRAAVPGMRERRRGRIVSVSSSAVREPIPHLMLSNAHRPGLLAAFKTLARHLAPDGITLNTILTGMIDTDRVRETGASAEGIPAGRLGTVEEYGALAAFLCSDRGAYLTGEGIRLDGGLTRSV